MSVSPANQLVALGGGKLGKAQAMLTTTSGGISGRLLVPSVTCVRQRTDMDSIAALCVRCDTDTLLRPVMQDLLGPEACAVWEESLPGRRAAEDAARVYSGRRYGDVFSMKV